MPSAMEAVKEQHAISAGIIVKVQETEAIRVDMKPEAAPS